MATEHWIVTPLYSPVPPMQVSAASPQLELGRAQLRLDELDDLHLRFTISGARLQVLIVRGWSDCCLLERRCVRAAAC